VADFLYSEFAKKKTGCFPERKPPGKLPVFEVMSRFGSVKSFAQNGLQTLA